MDGWSEAGTWRYSITGQLTLPPPTSKARLISRGCSKDELFRMSRIMPQRSERTADVDRTNNMYGTTLRVWDPAIQAWRITWINPVTGHREQQIGRCSARMLCSSELGPMAP